MSRPAFEDAKPPDSPPDSAGLEELAEDMVDVLERMQGISQGLAELGSAQRQQAIELASLRRDLLGDRRAQANRSAFDALQPTIDHLRAVQDSLVEPAGEMKLQLSGVLGSLRRALQELGFREFVVEPEEPFDPARMECLDYAEGELGIVLGVVRPGYLSGDVVVRPCGVLIADPATTATKETPPEDESDE